MTQKNSLLLISLLLDVLFYIFAWKYKFLEADILIEPFKLMFIPMLLYVFTKELLFKESKKIFYIRLYNILSSVLIAVFCPYLLFFEINSSNFLLFSLPFFTMLIYVFFEKIKGDSISFMLNTVSLFEAKNKNNFNLLDILYSLFICVVFVLWIVFGYLPAMR